MKGKLVVVAQNGTTVALPNFQAQQVCPPIGGNVLFFNPLMYDTVYLSYSYQDISPGNNTTPCYPLSTVSLDASRQIYGICPTNAAGSIIVAPGASGVHAFQPSTPSIETLSPLSIIFNQTLAAGATTQLFRISIARFLSLVGTFFAQSSNGFGTAPYYRLRFAWSFSNDNFDPIITDDAVGASGPLSFVSNFRHDSALETYGDTVTVFATNYDTNAMAYTHGFFGSYRGRHTFIRGRYPDDLSNEAQGLNTDNIILSLSQAAIAAGQKGPIVKVPLYMGDVVLTGTMSGETVAGQAPVILTPQPQTIVTGGPIVVKTASAGFFGQPSFKLPRRVCTLQVDNSAGTAAVTPNLVLMGSDSQ